MALEVYRGLLYYFVEEEMSFRGSGSSSSSLYERKTATATLYCH